MVALFVSVMNSVLILGMLAIWVTLDCWTREIADVCHLAYVERLKGLELFSIFG